VASSDTTHRVDLEVAMALLAERLAPDAVITYGAGNHALWAQRFLAHHEVGTLLAPRNGAMGFGVPAAVAASLTYPGRQVVSIAGDGCFLMNGQELATAMACGASPIVLVADNGQYGTIRSSQVTGGAITAIAKPQVINRR
jgi:acetolactate synthase-1/2/3 large subunit